MAITALSTKAVGSVVKLKFNGALRNFIVVHQGKPSSIYDDSCNGTWLLMKDTYTSRRWNSVYSDNYAYSEIHSYLNGDFLNLFDADMQAQVKQVKIPYSPGSTASYSVYTKSYGLSCKIFLLSAREVGFTTSHSNSQYMPGDGAKLDYFLEDETDEAKKLRVYSSQWWRTRSPDKGNGEATWGINNAGSATVLNIKNAYYVRPALVLPSSLLVSDTGEVSTNTAPTTPESITIPDTIQGGSTIEISWTASTDAENNLEGYIVERSTNGGSSWSQVYQGSALKTTNTVAAGTQSVMYRVKAYDSDGLYSGYKTSGQVTVINNTAPAAPASITVPNTVYGGQTITVTWGAATDPDGDAVTYALERQIDGGDWAQIYTGSNLSYTDSITRGWASVAYRVKAIDSRSASGPYATSPTRTVNNNLAPSVICSQTSGTDLGPQNTGFSVDYKATDPDGDEVTVTEAIDSQVQRTFRAAPDETYTFMVTGETFMKVLNGDHALSITASDGKAETVHKLLFKKEITTAMITLVDAVPADARIAVCILSVNGSIPADAALKVEVTNNGLDDEPVWEDCTSEVKTGANHVFENEAQTNGWAFNFKVTASRGPSGEGGYINSVQGGFQ